MVSPERVWFDEDQMWVALSDGRTLGVPLAWFPKLLQADDEARAAVELSVEGLHWPELDEDLSVRGLLGMDGENQPAREANEFGIKSTRPHP